MPTIRDGPCWVAVPFASAYKYSAVEFEGRGAWYVGAPEVLLAGHRSELGSAQAFAELGHRVLVVAHTAQLEPAGTVPEHLTPAGLVVCSDEIRHDAAETIAYFEREHVTTKVISGDNPLTVAAIAARCGVPGAERWIDAGSLPADDAGLGEAASDITVFGRVTPEVKRALVRTAQAHNEVVAMTGDGVNDTLALKDADLGIAMGAGSAAAKSVAEIVLLDNRFATLPGVVAEGRRVIANIERVARLFVTKTIWAATFAVIVGIGTMSYPILPRQLTVIDALTIGIPGFVLSFQSSHEPARAGFIRRVLKFCVPVGVVIGVSAMAVFATLRTDLVDADRAAAQSGTTLTLSVLGLVALYELMQPLDRVRATLLTTLVMLLVGAYIIGPVADFFLLQMPSTTEGLTIGVGVLAGSIGIVAVSRQQGRIARFANAAFTRLEASSVGRRR